MNTTGKPYLGIQGFWQSQSDGSIFTILTDGRIFYITQNGYIHLKETGLPQDCLQIKWNDPQLTDDRLEILNRLIERHNTEQPRSN